MSETQTKSAIRLLGVTVERVEFADTPVGERRGDQLIIVWSLDRRMSADEFASHASCAVRISIWSRPGDAPFSLDATLVGSFQREGADTDLSLGTFMQVNGPAQVVPFVREFVANLTARSRQGIVMLPSVNLVQLVREIDGAGSEREQ